MTNKKIKILIFTCIAFVFLFSSFNHMSVSPVSGATYSSSLLDRVPLVDDFKLTGSEFPNKTGSWGISVAGENGKDMHQTVTINADGGLALLNDKYGNTRSTGIEAVNTLKAIRKIDGVYTELELNPYEYLEYEEHTKLSGRKIDNLDTSFYNIKFNPLGFDEQGNKLNFNHNGDYLGFQILVDTNNSNFTGLFPEEYSGSTEVRLAGKSTITPEPVRVEAREYKDGQLLLPIHYEIGDTGYVGGVWNINSPFENEKILLENNYKLKKVTLDEVPVNSNLSGTIDKQQHTIVFWFEKNTTSSTSYEETSKSADSSKYYEETPKYTENSRSVSEILNFGNTLNNENTHDTKNIEGKETTEDSKIETNDYMDNISQPHNFSNNDDTSDTRQLINKTKITKKINKGEEVVYNELNKEMNWEITVAFGNDTAEWNRANIVDEVPSILEIQDIEITNQEKQDISEIGRLEVKNNQVRFEISRVDNSFKFLSDKTVTMNIKTKFRSDISGREIEKYMNN